VTVVAGEVEVWLGQATVRLGPGDELVLPAGERHGGRAGAGSRSVHVFAADQSTDGPGSVDALADDESTDVPGGESAGGALADERPAEGRTP
jgi:quercetin dioxygenase-like cupin family protein